MKNIQRKDDRITSLYIAKELQYFVLNRIPDFGWDKSSTNILRDEPSLNKYQVKCFVCEDMALISVMSKTLSTTSQLIALRSGFFWNFYGILVRKISGNAVKRCKIKTIFEKLKEN